MLPAPLASLPARIPVVALPAPVVAPETFLRVAPGACGAIWAPPEGLQLAAAGVAARIDVTGARRFEDLREQADALFARLDVRGNGPAPRLIGGLAFAAGGATGPWSAFGDGSFVLPRLTYLSDGERAWLLCAGEAAGNTDLVLSALAAPAPRRLAPLPAHVTQMAPAAWRDLVGAIRAEIAGGRFEKIVIARACRVDLPRALDDLAVLERLAADHPDCTRFAIRRGGATFLGATPERLVARRGAEVLSEALAGSIAPDRAAHLPARAKDRGEHELVVREIALRLAPLCATLDVPDAPEVRRLRHVAHLRTPISGRLRGDTHVLELAAALHPTPATGGVPTAGAVSWIAAHEPQPRGWYAGPIGWCDAAGDGELVVALRSGLLCHSEMGVRAHVFAGAGIVAGSDADAEWNETGLKQLTLLRALGAA